MLHKPAGPAFLGQRPSTYSRMSSSSQKHGQTTLFRLLCVCGANLQSINYDQKRHHVFHHTLYLENKTCPCTSSMLSTPHGPLLVHELSG